jgi:hypothetical protein
MKSKILFFLLIVNSILHSQIGGENSFAFLNLPFNARSAALGNDFITSKDQDLNLAIQNPSLLNPLHNKQLGFNQAILASGINYGMLTYGKTINEYNTYGSFRYVNYGNMNRYDEAGTNIGKFYAGDFILGAGLAKQINPLISIGSNVNLIYSQYETNASFGISVDLAGTYEIKEKNLTMTALVKNAGYQFKGFQKDSRAPLPTEFQFAIGHKFKHAPFRFSLLVHHLNRFDLTYIDPSLKPTIDVLTGDTIAVKLPGFGEKFFRHFTYQLELILSKNLHVRTAFDYHRRQELKLAQKPGIAGFSFGIGMYFKRFSLDYGLIAYSSAGFNNLFTFSTNLGKWRSLK